jgi:hypothetical protein
LAKIRPVRAYRTFWQRIRNLKNRLDEEILEHAFTLVASDWISFYGGGRHKNFVYQGHLYPEHHGRTFHGISAFLKTIDRYAEKSTIWSRLKAGWELDTALSIPVAHETERKGLIYKLTRLTTGQIYIGLTIGSLEQRWIFHLNFARDGGQTRLARAIRDDGPDGFLREVIQEGITDLETLRKREIFWVEELDTRDPNGLNTAKPGGLGAPRGKKIEIDGEIFPSIKEATEVLALRTGLATHVVEKRLRNGEPLPAKARKHSKHPDAGSNLFRRWRAMLKRHPGKIDAAWADNYDRFKSDVETSFSEDLELVREDDSQPWGPTNFAWVTTQRKLEKSHGKAMRVHDIEYPSLKAVADAYGIGLSTLKDRIDRQGMTPDQAVDVPLSATSYRSHERIIIDGRPFRSKRQAILYLVETKGITEHQAKYRLSKRSSS